MRFGLLLPSLILVSLLSACGATAEEEPLQLLFPMGTESPPPDDAAQLQRSDFPFEDVAHASHALLTEVLGAVDYTFPPDPSGKLHIIVAEELAWKAQPHRDGTPEPAALLELILPERIVELVPTAQPFAHVWNDYVEVFFVGDEDFTGNLPGAT